MLDVDRIQYLISELGFTHSTEFIGAKLRHLLEKNNDIVVVYKEAGKVVGLMTLHFAVQLAFAGDIMTIGYLIVDEMYRGKGIGRQLEEYACRVAEQRQCSFIEVYSQAKRVDAHRFYERQGYTVTEKFFSKEIASKL